jgi:antitoxin (DNA-binding transcriptional repressor) of toxin-antitoxin stability system
MLQISTRELPKNINRLIDQVEDGESIQIIRAGKPIAIMIPQASKRNGWKRKIKKVKLSDSVSVQSYIEEERSIG